MNRLKAALDAGELPLSRLEAFSDGVIAIIITILVLEIKVPELHPLESSTQLMNALVHLLPKILSYVVSFIVVAIWWVAHHHLFSMVTRTNRGVLWLNSIFLMFLAFIPFPTALMGEYAHEAIAVMIYGIAAALTGLSFFLLRWYVTAHAKLTKHEISSDVLRSSLRRSILSPLLYTIAGLSAWASPRLAMVLYVLIPLYYIVPGLFERMARPSESR